MHRSHFKQNTISTILMNPVDTRLLYIIYPTFLKKKMFLYIFSPTMKIIIPAEASYNYLYITTETMHPSHFKQSTASLILRLSC